jgi:addiction module HigA family antidote
MTRGRTESPPHPGQILLRAYLRPRGIQQTQLARRVAIHPSEISRLVSGRRDVSPVLACKLAAAFGTTPDYWLLLQMDYDLWRTRSEKGIKPFPVSPRRRRSSSRRRVT